VVQVAVTSHVCTPLPEHWRDPGEHVPVHVPEVQLWLHMMAVPQLPPAEQVSTPLPEQAVAPGAHTPVHPPTAHA
jgi:hypothetical protein